MIDLRLMNHAIIRLAPKHEARDDAPSNDRDLFATIGRAIRPVWAGASERCIYGDPHVNHAFRAWHDATHCLTLGAFTLDGETLVCEAQIRAFMARYPSAPDWCARLIRLEIIDQAEAYLSTGQFLADQATFVRERLLRK